MVIAAEMAINAGTLYTPGVCPSAVNSIPFNRHTLDFKPLNIITTPAQSAPTE